MPFVVFINANYFMFRLNISNIDMLLVVLFIPVMFYFVALRINNKFYDNNWEQIKKLF